jgi:hypothetical protein
MELGDKTWRFSALATSHRGPRTHGHHVEHDAGARGWAITLHIDRTPTRHVRPGRHPAHWKGMTGPSAITLHIDRTPTGHVRPGRHPAHWKGMRVLSAASRTRMRAARHTLREGNLYKEGVRYCNVISADCFCQVTRMRAVQTHSLRGKSL